jgi:flagellar biosynthesis protein
MASDRQLAVALQYLRNNPDAPQVVAKGRENIAEKILEIAKKNNVPVHQDADLVEILVHLELGDFIPPELYKAIAEILAHLYRVNKFAGP